MSKERYCLACGIKALAELPCAIGCNRSLCDCVCKQLVKYASTQTFTTDEIAEMFPKMKKDRA